jgi:hypothetical protein
MYVSKEQLKEYVTPEDYSMILDFFRTCFKDGSVALCEDVEMSLPSLPKHADSVREIRFGTCRGYYRFAQVIPHAALSR